MIQGLFICVTLFTMVVFPMIFERHMRPQELSANGLWHYAVPSSLGLLTLTVRNGLLITIVAALWRVTGECCKVLPKTPNLESVPTTSWQNITEPVESANGNF